MRFFCPTCQTWHDATDIAADMYDICQQEVIIALQAAASQWSVGAEEPFIDRMEGILNFLGPQNAELHKQYLFKPDQILAHSSRQRWAKDSLSALFTLDFDWVLDIYRSSGAEERDNRMREEQNERDRKNEPLLALEEFTPEQRAATLFSSRMDFVFSRAGSDSRMINYIGPGRKEASFPDEKLFPRVNRIRACSFCGRILSETLGRAPETVIGLVGGPRAGKTSCIVALASRLCSDNRGYGSLTIGMRPGDQQWKALEKEIANFERGYRVRKTEQKIAETPSYSLLVQIGNNVERVVTFIDMPGEFWETGGGITNDFYEKYGKLYEMVDCIWFLISKLGVHLTDLRDRDDSGEINLEAQRLLDVTADDSATVQCSNSTNVNANLQYLKTQLRAHGRQLAPMAVIITKSEVVLNTQASEADIARMQKYGLFPVSNGTPSCSFNTNREELNAVLGYDKNKRQYYLKELPFYERSIKIRDYLKEIKPSLLRAIEINCPMRCYFAMAAYGHPAAEEDKQSDSADSGSVFSDLRETELPRRRIEPMEPTPYREMFPLIWSMAICGVLPATHNVGYLHQSIWEKILKSHGGKTAWDQPQVRFQWRKPPQGDGKKEKTDDQLIWEDMRNNLLLPGAANEPRSFKWTELHHERGG